MLRAAYAALLSLAASPAASDFVLHQPIDCSLGDTCYIQHLPDDDPGPGARDFTCGSLTYDGHKGTDFALPSLAAMQSGVTVLAAAPGVVAGVRDDMADRYATDTASADIAGRECGNGVVLRHDDGWETQYCHMRRGSVLVSPGDRVAAGDPLGQVGLSGQTQFPHVHLSVRHDGATVDPFAPEAGECGAPGPDLWADTPAFTAGGVIAAGFAPGIPDYDRIKQGEAAQASLPANAPGLVLFGYAYGSHAGDILRLDIQGPDGPFLAQDVTLDTPQAQFFRATGKRLSQGAWPTGTYTGTVTLLREGEVIDVKTATTRIR